MSTTTLDRSWWDFQKAVGRAGRTLTASQHRVLVALTTYANGPTKHPVLGNARPGKKRLAHDTGYSMSTVTRALDALVKMRWIVVTAPGGNQHGHGRATTYQLQIPATHRPQAQESPAEGRWGKGVTSQALDAPEWDSTDAFAAPKGATGDTLEAPKGATGDTHREPSVTQKGPTDDTPPTHDRLTTSPPTGTRPHTSPSEPRSAQGLIARSTVGLEAGVENSPTSVAPSLRQALSDHGIPLEYHGAVLRAAETDPTTTASATGRLSASPRYGQDLLAHIKRERAAEIDASPRCEDHESNAASHCSSCRADIMAGDRPREYLGKRYSPTGLGQP